MVVLPLNAMKLLKFWTAGFGFIGKPEFFALVFA
jgi:hypothetical protein